MEILPISATDVLDVKYLQPEGWTDIVPMYDFYAGSDFCFPFKAVVDGEMVGVGTVIFNVNTAWLAHIIVDANYRRKGIGYKVTEHLVNFAEHRGCKILSLLATTSGKPVYAKLGFETEVKYTIYKGPEMESLNNFNIRPLLKSKHLKDVLALDYQITGENRQKMIECHLKNSMVYLIDRKVVGYYLPQLGNRPIYAINNEAGIELMRFRCSEEENFIGVPVKNESAIQFLLINNYQEVFTCDRMMRGEPLNWKPQCIFARAGGFYG